MSQQPDQTVTADPRPGPLTDRELIERVLAGDGRAERALYDAHVDRVFRLCYRLSNGDASRAEDFAQETFVRAFERLNTFRGDAALATWLHSIAVSVALNGMRRVKRWNEREVALEDAPMAGEADRRAEPRVQFAYD